MGHHLYDENKALKIEVDGLRERLRARDDEQALGKLIERVTMMFLAGNAAFYVERTAPAWVIRFRVDKVPTSPASPTAVNC